MKRRLQRMAAMLTAVFLLLTLAACGKTDDTGDSGSASGNTADITSLETLSFPQPDDVDNEQVIDTTGATAIVFDGETATVSGTGASASGATVTVRQGGVYTISGSTQDGGLIVDADDSDIVQMVFENAQIQSQSTAAVFVKNAGKTVLNAPADTVNTLTDAETYSGQDTDGEPDSTVFAKDDLTVNGNGTFQITANYNDALKTNDTLFITGATLEITSVDDGIVGKDFVCVSAGKISINASGDGIKTTYDTDMTKGAVCISGGTLNIEAGADGIQTDAKMLLTGGTYNIVTGGGNANAEQKAQETQKPGAFGRDAADSMESQTESTGSYKALKCAYLLEITDGEFTIDAADDALHSNHTIRLSGGSFSIATGDDGVHADTLLEISGGELQITKSYEGLEAADIQISGGTMQITASDDGLNAAGGNDASQSTGPMGGDPFAQSSGSMTISGGNIIVDASGDGLDSNGDITMTGGTVLVNGPTNGGNGALDYAGAFQVNGGTLVAVGSAQMAQSISESSTVYSVSVGASGSAGKAIQLLDDDGNVLLAFVPTKSWSNAMIAAPCIEKGETYTVALADYTGGTTENGLLTGAQFTNSTTIGSFTASSVCSTVGSVSGQMGAGGQSGGRQPDMGGQPNSGKQSGGVPGQMNGM